MTDIQPFRAFRYEEKLLSKLPRLICPPYDVIPPEEQKRLSRRHPANFIKVELPSGKAPAKYSGAARLWRQWLKRGVMAREGAPCFYFYEAVFSSQADGRTLVRRGFFAALRLVPWGKGVHPHEKTLPTPKADRLKLFKAMRTQTSSIQCLFQDSTGRSSKILDKAMRGPRWVEFRDEAGVRHKIWRVTDAATLTALQKILRRAPVVIADGHHRYETSRAYSAWARGKWGKRSPASNYVMTYFSPADDPGLEVLPTHRAVGWDKRKFVNLEKWGRLEPVSGLKALTSIMKREKSADARQVGVYHEGKFYRYRFTKVPPGIKNTPHRDLAVACLHAGPLDGLGKEDFVFTRRPEDAVQAARRMKGWAFFLAPNTVAEVIRVAAAGYVMPPKSTYFYPKLPSGLVSHSLFGEL
ncbi:MAG: DUF1015 domain-containing protein [Elusimicrobia bacterium]|nr:DUF1015 domain-containing protein [Elusimicrobiota bacterium]